MLMYVDSKNANEIMAVKLPNCSENVWIMKYLQESPEIF